MRKLLLIPAALFIIGCGSDNPTKYEAVFYVCDCKQMQQVRDDIKQTIAPANNKSDEEMEDVIKQLQQSFIETTCPKKVLEYNPSQHEVPLKTDSCSFYFN